MNTTTLPQKSPVRLSAAFRFGLEDGRTREPFAPEIYFTRHSDKVQYAVAYEIMRGANEMTRQFTHAA